MKGDRALRPEWFGATGAPQDNITALQCVYPAGYIHLFLNINRIELVHDRAGSFGSAIGISTT